MKNSKTKNYLEKFSKHLFQLNESNPVYMKIFLNDDSYTKIRLDKDLNLIDEKTHIIYDDNIDNGKPYLNPYMKYSLLGNYGVYKNIKHFKKINEKFNECLNKKENSMI